MWPFPVTSGAFHFRVLASSGSIEAAAKLIPELNGFDCDVEHFDIPSHRAALD